MAAAIPRAAEEVAPPAATGPAAVTVAPVPAAARADDDSVPMLRAPPPGVDDLEIGGVRLD